MTREDCEIWLQHPLRAHRNARATYSVRLKGVTLKLIKFRAYYPEEQKQALEKAEKLIDKLCLKNP